MVGLLSWAAGEEGGMEGRIEERRGRESWREERDGGREREGRSGRGKKERHIKSSFPIYMYMHTYEFLQVCMPESGICFWHLKVNTEHTTHMHKPALHAHVCITHLHQRPLLTVHTHIYVYVHFIVCN